MAPGLIQWIYMSVEKDDRCQDGCGSIWRVIRWQRWEIEVEYCIRRDRGAAIHQGNVRGLGWCIRGQVDLCAGHYKTALKHCRPKAAPPGSLAELLRSLRSIEAFTSASREPATSIVSNLLVPDKILATPGSPLSPELSGIRVNITAFEDFPEHWGIIIALHVAFRIPERCDGA